MLRPIRKCFLSLHHMSSIIYSFKYQWNTSYIGRTSQSLEVRIGQYGQVKIQKGGCDHCINASTLSALRHLLNNPKCASFYITHTFSALTKACSVSLIKVLETIYNKSLQPSVCIQKVQYLALNVVCLWYMLRHVSLNNSDKFCLLILNGILPQLPSNSLVSLVKEEGKLTCWRIFISFRAPRTLAQSSHQGLDFS